MKAITKLTALALSVAGVIGGAALAQTTLDPARKDNPATANYSISPNSNLKRDGSLSSEEKAAPMAQSMDSSTTTMTTQTTTQATPPMAAAPVAAAPVDAAPAEQAMPPARVDRN